MVQTHIVTRFDKELSEIEALLVQMSDKVTVQMRESAHALKYGDAELAEKVASADTVINNLEKTIDEKAIRLIALRQPMAEDLRSAVSTLKISQNLERMGDYAKTLSYRVRTVNDFSAMKPVLKRIANMSNQVADMLDMVMVAYVNQDLEKAEEARLADVDINERTDAMFRELLTYMMENPRNIEPCTHLLFIAKNLERSGDQVKNIAEQVHYLVTGETFED